MKEVLNIEGLSAGYAGAKEDILKQVFLSLHPGKITGLVGESGCGKTTLLKTILDPKMHGIRVREGSICYGETDLLRISEKERQRILGNEIGMIVQDSISSLNPIKKIRIQIQELLREKKGMDREKALKRGKELLLRLHCPEDTMEKYPFQLSGGQRQRVIIAMSFLLEPKILLADEPTTALDVTVQAQILKEMLELKEAYHTAILLISHNLGVIAQAADEIGVMYQGEMVEYGRTEEILKEPSHPYTKALIRCIPNLHYPKSKELYRIPDEDVELLREKDACCFVGRCEQRQEICTRSRPLKAKRNGGWAACHLLHSVM